MLAKTDSDEEEENAAPVKVTFARHQPDHVKKIQEQSFQHNSKKIQEESWIHTTYVPTHETLAHVSINIITNTMCFILLEAPHSKVEHFILLQPKHGTLLDFVVNKIGDVLSDVRHDAALPEFIQAGISGSADAVTLANVSG